MLFINALASAEGGWSAGLFAGLGAATVGLAVLFYCINLIAQKLPLRPLFIITSAFLFAMAIKFIGEAVQEFQEQSILPFTELKSLKWLEAIGLNATLEALSAQLLVVGGNSDLPDPVQTPEIGRLRALGWRPTGKQRAMVEAYVEWARAQPDLHDSSAGAVAQMRRLGVLREASR